jgi:hypothetical protein
MIRRYGYRLIVSGSLTLANVAAALSEANAPIGAGLRSVDLAEVTHLDSSALPPPRRPRGERLNRSLVHQSSQGSNHPDCTAWQICCPPPRRTTEFRARASICAKMRAARSRGPTRP